MREKKKITHALFKIAQPVLPKILFFITCIAALAACYAFSISAAGQISETVSLANARKNQSGEGYYWDNIKDTLTLNGLNITTTDDYGLKLPDNATVVLVGNNTISAAKVALLTTGTTVFKGSGSLTLNSGETGAVLADATSLGKVSFLSGKYKIIAQGDGIYSDNVRLYISGGEFEINSGGYAIYSRSAELNSTVLSANGPVFSTEPLAINNAELEINALSGNALQSGKELRFSSVRLISGEDSVSATEIGYEDFSGGAYLKTIPTYIKKSYSTVFGENVPAWVDYAVFIAAAAGLAAVIAFPLILRKRNYKKKMDTLDSIK